MSLTKEQIKNLRKGDPIVINTEIHHIDKAGNIWFNAQTHNCVLNLDAVSPALVSLPSDGQPKYDPCRLFKKGDVVRLKDWNGRCPEMYSGTNSWFNHPPRCKNGNLEVREDEKNSKVEIGIIGADCAHAATAPAYLELVTPVEELEPYYIEETEYEFCVTIMVGERKDFPAIYHKRMHPHAKEAAEAECNRLNAEWRKEQNND